MLIDPDFVMGLINILEKGSIELKTKSVQVMLAGLALPSDKFESILISTDAEKTDNVASALVKAMCQDIQTGTPNADFIRSAVDLLTCIVKDSKIKNCLIALASTEKRRNTTRLPFDIVPCAQYDSEHAKISESMLYFLYAPLSRFSGDITVVSSDNQGAFDSLQEYVDFNDYHFPLNVLFCPAVKSNDYIIAEVLEVCKVMVKSVRLRRLWLQYSDMFGSFKAHLNRGIAEIADAIERKLVAEGNEICEESK
ncbi:hypothetical protein PMAYCL1PPCAC_03537 [Pristionchus mayeri]|uniref:Uncharacterized protein n=1 Tax=Pristionchus mayeri TaxID=1317129 RepID=A0AAN4Z8P4_9BILA|nr:hypothetical protein PMAYCL1PPCAC_03537 [Pristionchus mayeri]